MPKIKLDLLNIEIVKNSLILLQNMLNDERIEESVRKEYGDKLGEIINEHRK